MEIQVQNLQPIFDSYEVIPGRFRAGEYPCSIDNSEAYAKARWLLDNGYNYFIDLTEAGEYNLRDYASIIKTEAENYKFDIIHNRIPIIDMNIPSREWMSQILDTIDVALENGDNIYLHCYGGIGRTGTVVGCYLVRHGMSGQEALSRIAELRRDIPDGWKESPETEEQRKMIFNWKG